MFRHAPIEVIKSWPPRSPNPVTKVSEVIILTSILSILLTIVFGLRVYSRLVISRTFGRDDWMAVPVFFTVIASNIVLALSTKYGWGFHVWDIPPGQLSTVLYLLYAYVILFVTANSLIKLVILLFYYKIFALPSDPSPIFRRLVKAFFIILVMIWIAFLFLCIFVCKPIKAYWHITKIKGQKCYDVAGYKAYGFIDVVSDICLLLLPQWRIWKLHMGKKKKFAVLTVMSFALFAVIASIMRLPFIFKTMKTYDATWHGTDLSLWSSVELTVGLGCTCAPALRALFTRKVDGQSHGSYDRFNNDKGQDRLQKRNLDPLVITVEESDPVITSRTMELSDVSRSKPRWGS